MKRDQILANITASGYVNPANILPEDQVLSRLLQESAEFERFYNSERRKIRKETFWYLNPLLTSNIITEPIYGEKNKVMGYVINIKSPVIDPAETAGITHELVHIIMTEQGFTDLVGLTPEAAAVPEYRGFLQGTASALQNMLIGPHSNSMLAPYGFDIWAYYDSASSLQRHQLEPVPVEPQHPLEKLYQISFYVQKALDWEIANKVSPRETNDFLSWYESRYPIISAEAKEVLEWVKRTGHDTSTKARRIFKEMIRKYDVEDFFTVN